MHGIYERTIHGDPDPELQILLKFVEVVVKDVNYPLLIKINM